MNEWCEFCSRRIPPTWGPFVCDRCTNWTTDHPYIDPLAVIGRPPQMREREPGLAGVKPVIARLARIEALCTVDSGHSSATTLGACWLMKSVHVGHDARVGDLVEIAPMSSLGGFVTIEDGAHLGQGVTVKPHVVIGAGSIIGMGAVVVRDVPADEVWAGNPARKLRSV